MASDLHSVEAGSGVPLIVLHGAGVDHREPMAAFEPAVSRRPGIRRVYVDLPGMGRSPVAPAETIVDSLISLVDEVADERGFLLAAHSLGAYFARAVSASRADSCRGIALLCPATGSTEIPSPSVVIEEPGYADELDPSDVAGFDDYFVRRTRATARRYRDAVLPGVAAADGPALERMFAGFDLESVVQGSTSDVEAPPTLIVAGRRDSIVGWRGAVELADRTPASTLVVADGAGHALPHELPELLAWALSDWLDRALGPEVAS